MQYFPLQIVSLAALIHYRFHMDKAPPQPPYQTHFCGEFFHGVAHENVVFACIVI